MKRVVIAVVTALAVTTIEGWMQQGTVQSAPAPGAAPPRFAQPLPAQPLPAQRSTPPQGVSFERTVDFLKANLPSCRVTYGSSENQNSVNWASRQWFLWFEIQKSWWQSSNGLAVWRASIAEVHVAFPLIQLNSKIDVINASEPGHFRIAVKCLGDKACIQSETVAASGAGWYPTTSEALFNAEIFAEAARSQPAQNGLHWYYPERPSDGAYRAVTKGNGFSLINPKIKLSVSYHIECGDRPLAERIAKALSHLIELGGGRREESPF